MSEPTTAAGRALTSGLVVFYVNRESPLYGMTARQVVLAIEQQAKAQERERLRALWERHEGENLHSRWTHGPSSDCIRVLLADPPEPAP